MRPASGFEEQAREALKNLQMEVQDQPVNNYPMSTPWSQITESPRTNQKKLTKKR